MSVMEAQMRFLLDEMHQVQQQLLEESAKPEDQE